MQPASSYDPNLARSSLLPDQRSSHSADNRVFIPVPGNDQRFQKVEPAPPPPPSYAMFGGEPVNGLMKASHFIGLPTNDGAIGRSLASDGIIKSNDSETIQFTDTTQATESIKALLQGAVEDDDDDDDDPQPAVTNGNSPQQAPDVLMEALRKMNVGRTDVGNPSSKNGVAGLPSKEPGPGPGHVDGLSVTLLPHQVEGLKWMTEKEIGKRRKGVLPKGGILADDVRTPAMRTHCGSDLLKLTDP